MLIIRSSPELRMPASIRSFPNLMGLYHYHSAVLKWFAGAALSSRYHPNLRQISLFAVNMTAACDTFSGLPSGLLARDFLQSVRTFVADEFRARQSLTGSSRDLTVRLESANGWDQSH